MCHSLTSHHVLSRSFSSKPIFIQERGLDDVSGPAVHLQEQTVISHQTKVEVFFSFPLRNTAGGITSTDLLTHFFTSLTSTVLETVLLSPLLSGSVHYEKLLNRLLQCLGI